MKLYPLPCAWDGTLAEFWLAVGRVADNTDTEGDQAVLADVVALAQWAYEKEEPE